MKRQILLILVLICPFLVQGQAPNQKPTIKIDYIGADGKRHIEELSADEAEKQYESLAKATKCKLDDSKVSDKQKALEFALSKSKNGLAKCFICEECDIARCPSKPAAKKQACLEAAKKALKDCRLEFVDGKRITCPRPPPN